MARFVLVTIDNGNQDILKKYKTVEDVLRDIQYKDPSYFFIGDNETNTGYTFEQFIEKFGGKNE